MIETDWDEPSDIWQNLSVVIRSLGSNESERDWMKNMEAADRINL